MKELKIRLMEQMIGTELTAHLVYEAGVVPPRRTVQRPEWGYDEAGEVHGWRTIWRSYIT